MGVEPYILRQEESSDDSRKDIVVGLYEDIGQQDFATESEHLFQRAEIQVESRSPRREVPETEIDDCNVYQTLGRDAPVGHAVVGHEDTDRTRYDQCRNLGDGFLFYHQVTEQVGTVGRCTAGNDKSQKCEPCQWYQVRLPVVGCNERGTEKQDDVKGDSGQETEPEDRVVVAMSNFFLIGQGAGKATVLECPGNGGEDGQHAHHTVIGRCQDAGQENAECQIQQLLYSVADSAP